jgi:probable phosphoglycerate mutase
MSDATPIVYLLRHGETPWAAAGKHTGSSDIALNERGERQARELAPRLAGLRVDRVLSSPLQRAHRTAELALPDAAIATDADLTEWDYGSYEGQTTAAIRAQRPGWSMFRDGCPGGETLDAVAARADRVIARVRALTGNTLLVAHRDILRIVAVRWTGVAASEARHLLLDTASLSSLGYDHRSLAEPAIRRWNLPAGGFD